MGTFRALWMLRKETFSRQAYQRDPHRAFTRTTQLFVIGCHIVISFIIIVIPLVCFIPILLMNTTGTTILFFAGGSLTILLGMYFWVAPMSKFFSCNPDDENDDYTYRLHTISAMHRLNKKLSVLNLELRFVKDSLVKTSESLNKTFLSTTYMGELNLFIKETNDTPKEILVTRNKYDSYPKLKLLNVGPATFKAVEVQIVAREFNLEEGFVLTKLWKHTTWKALTFLVAQRVLKKDLSKYGPIWFQVHGTKKVFAAAKLDVEPDQFIKFLQLDIPVEEYEALQGLPLAWVEKLTGRTLAKV